MTISNGYLASCILIHKRAILCIKNDLLDVSPFCYIVRIIANTFRVVNHISVYDYIFGQQYGSVRQELASPFSKWLACLASFSDDMKS